MLRDCYQMAEGPFHKLIETFIVQHGADELPAMLAQRSASEYLCMSIRNLWDLTNREPEQSDVQSDGSIPRLFLQLLKIVGARKNLWPSFGTLPGASILASLSFAEYVKKQVGCLCKLLGKALLKRISENPATPCSQLMESFQSCLGTVLKIGALLPSVDIECVSYFWYGEALTFTVLTF